MLAILDSGQQALANVLSGVTEDAARRSPGPDRWSVLECMEHVAVAESYMLAQVENSTRAEAPLVNAEREKAIIERGTNRTERFETPDAAKPTGRFPTLRDAADHFGTTRARTVQFVENSTSDLRACLAHHPVIGTVNCYETLLLMAVHALRHEQQIREILVEHTSP